MIQSVGTRQNVKEGIFTRFTNHRAFLPLLMVILSIVFAVQYNAVFDKKLNLGGDNIYYYTCGKALAEGQGYTTTLTFTDTPQTHFPPGYSLFISGLYKIFPDNIVAIKITNGVLLYISLILLFLFIQYVTKKPFIAFFSTLFSCFQHNVLEFSTIMMSEMLYIFLSFFLFFLSVWMNERLLFSKSTNVVLSNKQLLKKRVLHIASVILFAGIAIYSFFVRTIGLTLIFALLLWLFMLSVLTLKQYLKNRTSGSEIEKNNSKNYFIQRIGLFLLLGTSFFIAQSAWTARDSRYTNSKSSYISVFMRKDGGGTMASTQDWTNRITNNIATLFTDWLPDELLQWSDQETAQKKIPTSGQWVKGIFIFLWLGVGFLGMRKYAALLLLFYIGGTIAVLMFYPEQYQGSRYMIPVIPLLFFLLCNGIAVATQFVCKVLFKIKKRDTLIPVTLTALIIFAAILLPRYSKAQTELRQIAKISSWNKYKSFPMNDFLNATEWCKKNLTDSSRLICRKPEIYYMFSGYRRSEKFPWDVEKDSLIDFLVQKKATHVIIDSWYRHAYATIVPAVQAYPEKFKIVFQTGTSAPEKGLYPTYVLAFNDKWGYHGNKVNNLKEGEGYEVYQDGRKFEGHYSKDLPNGFGTLYDKDGNIQSRGEWKDGELIKPIR